MYKVQQAVSDLGNEQFAMPIQPVDATHVLKRAAGVSWSSVFPGRPLILLCHEKWVYADSCGSFSVADAWKNLHSYSIDQKVDIIKMTLAELPTLLQRTANPQTGVANACRAIEMARLGSAEEPDEDSCG